MANIILLCISLVAGLAWNVFRKVYVARTPEGLTYSFFYNFAAALLCIATFLVWGGFGRASLFTVLMGVGFGLLNLTSMICNIWALKIGPMSYTTVIISFATLISAFSGVAFFNETLSWTQMVGIPLMLTSFVLAVDKSEDDKGFSLRWLGLSFAAFLTVGGIGIMQKLHGNSAYSEESNAFLVIAFLTVSISCAVVLALLREKGRTAKETGLQLKWNKDTLVLLACILLGGIAIAANNKLNLYLSAQMNSAVFFPIVNGGGLILTTLFAIVVFREKLTLKKWLGLFIGILSVLFLCIPSA